MHPSIHNRLRALAPVARMMTPESQMRMLSDDDLRALSQVHPMPPGGHLGSWLSEAWNNVTGTDLGEVAPYIAAGVGAAFGGAEVGRVAGQIVGQFSNLQSGGPQSAADILRSLGIAPAAPVPPPAPAPAPAASSVLSGNTGIALMIGLAAVLLVALK